MSIRRFFGEVPRKELAHGFLGDAKVFGELRRRQTEGVQLPYFVALRVELEAAGAAFAPAADSALTGGPAVTLNGATGATPTFAVPSFDLERG